MWTSPQQEQVPAAHCCDTMIYWPVGIYQLEA
jgi:hypothetical protein